MRHFRNFVGGILFGLASVVFATIGSAAPKDVVLTEDNVSRFLASFAEMRLIAIGEGLRTGADSDAAKNPVGAVIKAIKSSKLQTEAQRIAVSHGFPNIKDWADTGRAIGQAYLYVTGGATRVVVKDTLDKHKDDAIRELEKFGLVNEKQKQKLKENLDNASEQLAREPPKENVAIVKQMKPDIEAAVKLGMN